MTAMPFRIAQMLGLAGLVATTFAGPEAWAQAPCSYEVTILPEIDCGIVGTGPGTIAGLNNLGQIVFTADCGDQEPNSYLWNGGATLEVLPKPVGITNLIAEDINDAGLIVGEMSGPSWPSGTYGFIYDSNTGEFVTMLQSEDPDGRCAILAINSSGAVCGFRSVNDGGDPLYPWQPFVWDPENGITDLVGAIGSNSMARDISEDGTVVGLVGGTLDTLAFRYSTGELTIFGPVPNGITSSAHGVNNASQIIVGGLISLTPLMARAFLYEDASTTELPLPQGFDGTTNALEIPDDGMIIGSARTLSSPTVFHGCIWATGTVTLIDDLIDPTENLKVGLAAEINDYGLIVASGHDKEQGVVNVLLTPAQPNPGDANCDQLVDGDDILAVINTWGNCSHCQTDFNKDGIVNSVDLALVIENWNS